MTMTMKYQESVDAEKKKHSQADLLILFSVTTSTEQKKHRTATNYTLWLCQT